MLDLNNLLVITILYVNLNFLTAENVILKNNQLKSKSKFICSNPKDFQCQSNNKCLKQYQVCDGFVDCVDRSDEINCNWCNRTFNNEEMNRILIRNQNHTDQTSLNCFYKIINLKANTIIGVRLRQFSVGKFDSKTNKCQTSWIEIKESDLDEMDIINYGFTKENNRKKLKKDNSKAVHPNETKIGNYLKLSLRQNYDNGKFCGSLYNFGGSFYSNKQLVTITYNHLNEKLSVNESNTYEFEITFYSKDSLDPILHSKLRYQQAEKKINFNISKINYGLFINNNSCNRAFINCSNEEAEACLVSTPGYPGVYLKNQHCQFMIKNSQNQKLIFLNDHLEIDSTICHYNNSVNKQLLQSYFCDSGPRYSEECRDYLNVYVKNNDSNDDWILMKKICGMGRMPKIISSKKNIRLEFISSPEGIFANAGFLFYVLSEKVYKEKFDSLNTLEFKSQPELNSFRLIEKMQIDNCDSDMTTCIIEINESLIEEIYKTESKDIQFKIGYLFNINQYQSAGFFLKYILKSKKYNTIAINLDKYQPHGDTCRQNYFSLESTDKLYSEPIGIPLIKLCNKANFNQLAVKYFLIKTSDLINNKNLVVTYFNTNSFLNSKFNDFRISYEYLNFDWNNYKNDTLCDFIYDLNSDSNTPSNGILTNPKASIFYKTTEPFLKCKYRLVAKPNQYILLKVKSINFIETEESEDECDNIYFTNINPQSTKAKIDRCSKLNKKIIIKELKHSWSASPADDIFDDYYNSDDSNLNMKLCLCKSHTNMSIYYVSKYDTVEIEYNIRLENNLNDLRRNEFQISYEFIDRKCDSFLVKNYKSKTKAKLVFMPKLNLGIQTELVEFLNRSKADYNFYENQPFYASSESTLSKEIDNLKLVLYDNLNFDCKYNIRAPKNNFINVEFTDLILPKNCEHNGIRLYSNFSLTSLKSDLSEIFMTRPSPFIRLCTSDSKQKENLVIAEFFEESIANSNFSCYNAKNRICFLTSELANEHNPYKKKFKRTNFYNSLVIEIKSDNVRKFNFEIKYNFYSINLPSFKNEILEKNYKQTLGQQSDSILKINSKVEYETMYKNDDCEFKCYTIDDLNNSSFNSSFKVCIDESLVCDNEVHCIFNSLDEANCPIKLKAKTILMVLCSIFGFTLTVLFIFCIYKKYLMDLYKIQNKNLQNQFKSCTSNASKRNVRYSQADQNEKNNDSKD